MRLSELLTVESLMAELTEQEILEVGEAATMAVYDAVGRLGYSYEAMPCNKAVAKEAIREAMKYVSVSDEGPEE